MSIVLIIEPDESCQMCLDYALGATGLTCLHAVEPQEVCEHVQVCQPTAVVFGPGSTAHWAVIQRWGLLRQWRHAGVPLVHVHGSRQHVPTSPAAGSVQYSIQEDGPEYGEAAETIASVAGLRMALGHEPLPSWYHLFGAEEGARQFLLTSWRRLSELLAAGQKAILRLAVFNWQAPGPQPAVLSKYEQNLGLWKRIEQTLFDWRSDERLQGWLSQACYAQLTSPSDSLFGADVSWEKLLREMQLIAAHSSSTLVARGTVCTFQAMDLYPPDLITFCELVHRARLAAANSMTAPVIHRHVLLNAGRAMSD